jgi:tetratricopeptide (TPR) repeat protein
MIHHFKIVMATALLICAGPVYAQTADPSAAPVSSTTAATTPAQKPKLPIRAKTHDEYVVYQAAIAKKQDPDAMAKAAADFAAKFPDSDIRVLLYRASMKSYESAGDPEKMMQAALKVLELTKDDPEALLAVARVQEEHTSPMDLDRDQRMDQALANAQHSLATVDTDLVVPVNTQPESVEPYKKFLRATALSIIGSIQFKRQQYAEAEGTLRRAIDADPTSVDGTIILRLALALDEQKKYEDALQQANRAVELTKEDTDAGRAARNERDRLTAMVAQNSSPGRQDVAPPADHDQTPQGQ